jgi:D-xylose transport system ATP-binding protein
VRQPGIAQNLFLGRERNTYGLLTDAPMETAARETLQDLSVTTLPSVHHHVGSLPRGQRQAVAIAKPVLWHSQLVLTISHNMNDVFEIADRVAVLFLGLLARVFRAEDIDTQTVVELMTSGPCKRVDDRRTPRYGAGPAAADRAGSTESLTGRL